MLAWTVCPDAEMLDRARTDLRRALILQNSRVATRLDPVSRVRTHRNEERLRRIGLVICVCGLLLALMLALGSYAVTGRLVALHVAFVVIFAVLIPLFVALPALRRAGIARLDAMLGRRANAALRAWAEGVVRTYSIEGETLRSQVGDTTSARPLSGLTYGLLGEVALMLFAKPRAQNPKLIVLVGDSADRVVSALQGVEVETLSPELMPKTTLERSW